MATWPDPHGVLGVPLDASIDEMRLAYRDRMRALHPDRGGADDGVAHDEMAAVTEAWRRLSSEPGRPFEPGSVRARVNEYAAGAGADGMAALGDDGPAPSMLRPVLAITVVLLLAWMMVFVLIAFSQSG